MEIKAVKLLESTGQSNCRQPVRVIVVQYWRPGQEEDTPLSRLSDMLGDYDPQFQEPLARVREAASLVLMVLAVWEVVWRLAVRLMEESLTVRAQQRELWARLRAL